MFKSVFFYIGKWYGVLFGDANIPETLNERVYRQRRQ